MRRLTEIIGGSPNGTIPTVIASSLIEYRVEAPGHDALELIKRFYASIDYPRSMRDGNLMHLCGSNEEEIVFLSVWDNEENAAAAYDELAEPIGALVSEVEGGGVVRSSHRVHRFVVSEAASSYDASVAELDPSCVGYQIDMPIHGSSMYDLFCEKLAFPEEIPDGLLAHVAGETDFGWRTYTVWRTTLDSQRYFSERIIPASVDVVREEAIFPEIRPLEIAPTLFAVNWSQVSIHSSH